MSGTEVWIPLYTGDYLRGTKRFTTEQHGACVLLIGRRRLFDGAIQEFREETDAARPEPGQ